MIMLLRQGLTVSFRERFTSSSFTNISRYCCALRSHAASAASSRYTINNHNNTSRIMYSTTAIRNDDDNVFHVPTTKDRVLLGCVSYDPAVGDIWDQMKHHLRSNNNAARVPTFDYVLFTNYEQQVRALLDSQIDVAWNGPLAHVLAESLVDDSDTIVSLGMRDVDCDFESIIVTRKDVTDLHNTRLLAGAQDSPQAYVVPKYVLQVMHGIMSCHIEPNNVDLGKHGDTALGEIMAMQSLIDSSNHYHGALVSRMMWDRAISGQIASVNADKLQELYHIYTNVDIPKFDHCQFDALASNVATGKLDTFYTALHAMDYNDPIQQKIMKLEGIKQSWSKPSQEGYDIIRAAMKTTMLGRGQGLGIARQAQNYQPRMSSASIRNFSTTSATGKERTTSGIIHKQLEPGKSRIGVVGCGVAGLQVIRSMRARGFNNVTAFDKANDIGGLWQDNYDGYALQVGKQFYEMPDCEMTEAEWQELASGPTVQSYIKRFATQFHLMDHVQLNTGIERVVHNPDNDTWTFHTSTGKEHVFDYCVISTGMYSSSPFMPTNIAGQEEFRSSIIHSSEFRNAQALAKDKNVVVVGGGKSATDCSTAAAKAGAKSVTMVQRNAHWPAPLYIAGLIPFQHVFLSRLGQALVEAKVGVYPGSPSTIASYFRPIMGPIFAVVEALFAFQLGLKGDLRPKTSVVEDFYGYAQVQDGSFKAMRDSGRVQVQLGQIDRFTSRGVQVKGQEILAELVIFATGFNKDYSQIFEPDIMKRLNVQRDGLYLYRHILPPSVPGLAFVGSECATIFNSQILHYKPNG